jgi:hypothetical protein
MTESSLLETAEIYIRFAPINDTHGDGCLFQLAAASTAHLLIACHGQAGIQARQAQPFISEGAPRSKEVRSAKAKARHVISQISCDELWRKTNCRKEQSAGDASCV